jgi:hypothetical protein
LQLNFFQQPLEQKMEFFNAIMDLTLAQIFVIGATILVMFSGPSLLNDEGDDNSDYENASWNPASVNYKK